MNENAMVSQQQAEQSKLDQLYRESGGDINAMIKNPDLGFGAGMQLRSMANENAKLAAQAGTEQAKQDKLRIQGGIEKLNYGSQLLQGAKANPAMWPDISAEFKSMTGIDLGDQYDPAKVDALIAQGMSQKDMLGNEWKQKGYELDVMRLGEQQRHNRTSEGISYMNAQNRADGDGGKWKVDLERGVMYNDQGDVMPLAGGAIQKPESAAEKSARIKIENENRLADKDFAGSLAATAEAQKLFEGATGSGLGKARDAAYAMVGSSTEGAQKAAQLKVVAGKLIAGVPKFSGPQSDKDVQLYREMAGQIGDDSVPIETRKAALETVMALQTAEAERRKSLQQSDSGQAPRQSAIQHPKYGDITEDDIQATMQSRGMTREQVLQKLGVQ
jgi:hypothetical protein